MWTLLEDVLYGDVETLLLLDTMLWPLLCVGVGIVALVHGLWSRVTCRDSRRP